MKERYIELVRAYVRSGEETNLAAIGDMRHWLVENETPIEELVGMHEQAQLALRDEASPTNFADIVAKTSVCFCELAMAYSIADQRKKSLIDRAQRIDRERQRLESLGQMAGGVAHEVNNLLQPIMGMAELAIEDAPPGSELAQRLAIIQDCAHKAAAIARGVLTTARRHASTPRPAKLAAMLRRGVQFLSAVLPQDVKLELSIQSADEYVLCDEGELNQVLSNLVRNASDAMGQAGLVRVSLRDVRRERMRHAGDRPAIARYLELTIADHGAGMSAEVAAKAMQPFFTTKSATKGTGLGLSISVAIVQSWGGVLEIETVPQMGTRVRVALPIVEAAPDPLPGDGPAAPGASFVATQG